MVLDDIPLFSMLKGRLGYLTEREKLVAQNVANTDTPGYGPKDLKAFTFDDHLNRRITSSRGVTGGVNASPEAARHMAAQAGSKRATSYKPISAPDSEGTLDGNQVVLEEQMLKMNETRMSYDAAISFYQKSMNLLRMASRPPGR
jgi:flagellar basal-body rod protein FlgB